MENRPRAGEGRVGAAELVLVLDFGSQYSQLIARRVREAGVYCELLDGATAWPAIEARSPKAIILSGGPSSVYAAGAPQVDPGVLGAGIPVLGICYGMQLLAHQLGGRVEGAGKREYGPAQIRVEDGSPLFKDLPVELPVWMSHGDTVLQAPAGFTAIARSENSAIAAMTDGI
ncbi:MAG TPA: glutamine-hydrolyzing GMP synthase, partial [Candidatus Dormibacteraeota bacterium]|nr:glutamine-hydrolyzing GMP synthase [Candidatus Dormibacteraeota bacterium]